jgi:hypothetical protein
VTVKVLSLVQHQRSIQKRILFTMDICEIVLAVKDKVLQHKTISHDLLLNPLQIECSNVQH